MKGQPRGETTDQPHGVTKSVLSIVLSEIIQLTPEPRAHSYSILTANNLIPILWEAP